MYENGFVFTRLGHGEMQQTRSVRIDLSKFKLTSENRRILNRTSTLKFHVYNLPLDKYDFRIGKMAKDFYDSKFGTGVMSAQKIKQMLTDSRSSNFNTLFEYLDDSPDLTPTAAVGYAIAYASKYLIHYSYPFYDLNCQKDMGLGMMIRAILHAEANGSRYFYLGSLQRAADVYKLQFEGLEWFDGQKWSHDLNEVKNILAKI